MEDANFACDTANQAILRLTNELEFVKWVLEDESFRTENPEEYNFHDKAFEAKINYCVAEAKSAFEAMRFRDALKHGFYGNTLFLHKRSCLLLLPQDCKALEMDIGMHAHA